ncbi:MAG: hypothetical protein R3D62_15940 [Xanthobacteraceae bacterium]
MAGAAGAGVERFAVAVLVDAAAARFKEEAARFAVDAVTRFAVEPARFAVEATRFAVEVVVRFAEVAAVRFGVAAFVRLAGAGFVVRLVFAAAAFFAGALADVLRGVFGLAFALGLAADRPTFALFTGRRTDLVVLAIAFRSGLRLDGMQSTSQANTQVSLDRRSMTLDKPALQ